MSTSIALVAEGRYALFFSGQPCGEERWSLERMGDGMVATGEQVMEAPHPFPNRHEYRIALTEGWRVTGLDIVWSVGSRRDSADHFPSRRRRIGVGFFATQSSLFTPPGSRAANSEDGEGYRHGPHWTEVTKKAPLRGAPAVWIATRSWEEPTHLLALDQKPQPTAIEYYAE